MHPPIFANYQERPQYWNYVVPPPPWAQSPPSVPHPLTVAYESPRKNTYDNNTPLSRLSLTSRNSNRTNHRRSRSAPAPKHDSDTDTVVTYDSMDDIPAYYRKRSNLIKSKHSTNPLYTSPTIWANVVVTPRNNTNYVPLVATVASQTATPKLRTSSTQTEGTCTCNYEMNDDNRPSRTSSRGRPPVHVSSRSRRSRPENVEDEYLKLLEDGVRREQHLEKLQSQLEGTIRRQFGLAEMLSPKPTAPNNPSHPPLVSDPRIPRQHRSNSPRNEIPKLQPSPKLHSPSSRSQTSATSSVNHYNSKRAQSLDTASAHSTRQEEKPPKRASSKKPTKTEPSKPPLQQTTPRNDTKPKPNKDDSPSISPTPPQIEINKTNKQDNVTLPKPPLTKPEITQKPNKVELTQQNNHPKPTLPEAKKIELPQETTKKPEPTSTTEDDPPKPKPKGSSRARAILERRRREASGLPAMPTQEEEEDDKDEDISSSLAELLTKLRK
eukprot:NODE_1983_length_1729_cov_29.042341_g1691_i0.p1 GENE.NODE_1983_length_1729_cov_29.042341_g1691_i0~~NODE_1983_length_1729_cov_29.042341_g1691_i0.p1  ORF type:complete len:494 (-),score=107.55 NODE_1983_length_1729_cov_29.042341_g1691_i0:193-1674(-)